MQELDELLAEIDSEAPVVLVTDDASDGVTVLESLTADAGEEAPEYQIDRAALYEAQSNELKPAGEEDAAEVIAISEEKAKRVRNRKSKKGAIEAATEVTEEATTGDVIQLIPNAGTRSATLAKKANVADLVNIGIEASDIPSILEAMDTAPKKVQEKAYNLIRFVLGREHLSNYTRATIKLLMGGGLTVPELVKQFENGSEFNAAYKTGTARSQAQQMSRLFGIYGMVDKTNGRMALDAANPFVATVLSKIAA